MRATSVSNPSHAPKVNSTIRRSALRFDCAFIPTSLSCAAPFQSGLLDLHSTCFLNYARIEETMGDRPDLSAHKELIGGV